MVGYKTPRYLRFGWCGARLDDVMNYVPARADVAAHRGGRAGAAAAARAERRWRVGLAQHAVLPGPNSGLERSGDRRRARAPARRSDLDERPAGDRAWIGDRDDPPLATADDYRTASRLVAVAGVVGTLLACLALFR